MLGAFFGVYSLGVEGKVRAEGGKVGGVQLCCCQGFRPELPATVARGNSKEKYVLGSLRRGGKRVGEPKELGEGRRNGETQAGSPCKAPFGPLCRRSFSRDASAERLEAENRVWRAAEARFVGDLEPPTSSLGGSAVLNTRRVFSDLVLLGKNIGSVVWVLFTFSPGGKP